MIYLIAFARTPVSYAKEILSMGYLNSLIIPGEPLHCRSFDMRNSNIRDTDRVLETLKTAFNDPEIQKLLPSVPKSLVHDLVKEYQQIAETVNDHRRISKRSRSSNCNHRSNPFSGIILIALGLTGYFHYSTWFDSDCSDDMGTECAKQVSKVHKLEILFSLLVLILGAIIICFNVTKICLGICNISLINGSAAKISRRAQAIAKYRDDTREKRRIFRERLPPIPEDENC